VETFEQLRISLSRDEAGPLLVGMAPHEDVLSRRDALKQAFSEPLLFLHLKTRKPYEFVPLPVEGDYAAGIFKRPRPLAAHDRKLQPYEAENYEGAVFIISLSKDQIAWMQVNHRLGANKALLESFFSQLRGEKGIRDWKPIVQYLRDEQEYWEFVDKNRDRIAKISFEFIPPNALSAESRIYELLKIVKVEANPDTVQHIYKADPGQMNLESDTLASSARIAMAGGGEAEARAADNKLLYNSRTARKITQEVPEGEMPTEGNPAFIRRLRDWLFDR